MTSLWRKPTPWPALCTRTAVAALAIVGCSLLGRGDGRPGAAEPVAPGRVCRSDLPRGMELSRATYGFGDLRHRCPSGRHDHRRCVRTPGVRVRNSGRSRVYVTYIAGARRARTGTATGAGTGSRGHLSPGGRRWLYDIMLRGTADKPNTLEVVGGR